MTAPGVSGPETWKPVRSGVTSGSTTSAALGRVKAGSPSRGAGSVMLRDARQWSPGAAPRPGGAPGRHTLLGCSRQHVCSTVSHAAVPASSPRHSADRLSTARTLPADAVGIRQSPTWLHDADVHARPWPATGPRRPRELQDGRWVEARARFEHAAGAEETPEAFEGLRSFGDDTLVGFGGPDILN